MIGLRKAECHFEVLDDGRESRLTAELYRPASFRLRSSFVECRVGHGWSFRKWTVSTDEKLKRLPRGMSDV